MRVSVIALFTDNDQTRIGRGDYGMIRATSAMLHLWTSRDKDTAAESGSVDVAEGHLVRLQFFQ